MGCGYRVKEAWVCVFRHLRTRVGLEQDTGGPEAPQTRDMPCESRAGHKLWEGWEAAPERAACQKQSVISSPGVCGVTQTCFTSCFQK